LRFTATVATPFITALLPWLPAAHFALPVGISEFVLNHFFADRLPARAPC